MDPVTKTEPTETPTAEELLQRLEQAEARISALNKESMTRRHENVELKGKLQEAESTIHQYSETFAEFGDLAAIKSDDESERIELLKKAFVKKSDNGDNQLEHSRELAAKNSEIRRLSAELKAFQPFKQQAESLQTSLLNTKADHLISTLADEHRVKPEMRRVFNSYVRDVIGKPELVGDEICIKRGDETLLLVDAVKELLQDDNNSFFVDNKPRGISSLPGGVAGGKYDVTNPDTGQEEYMKHRNEILSGKPVIPK